MITLPRPLLVALALCFSAYSVVLGLLSLPVTDEPIRVVGAIAVFCVCLVLSVATGRSLKMPDWLGGLNAGVVFAMALICSSALPPTVGGGGDVRAWYVSAAGCLLVVTMVRRMTLYAWIGLTLLVAETWLRSGFAALVDLGVVGVVLWVMVAYVGTRALAKAMRDVQQFARAEREAVEWRAAQDAHHFERQVRLTQTSRVALPMLRHIAEVDGDIDDAAKQECRVLEQTIRDEIRGRRLLNDAVRDQVISARRRGAFVQVLDDGGLDDLDPVVMEPVLDQVASAIAGVRSDRIIIRTAPKGSDRAVTVVGISSDPTMAALGMEDEAEEVDLWLELDRPVPAAR